MVPEKYRLASVGRFLVEAYERRRPGIAAWTPALEAELLAEGDAELARMEVQCRELGVDDPAHWQRARALLRTVLLPRYAALAKDEQQLARAGYHLWRGGDLIARGAFAAAGLLLGAAAVAIPWIPVTEKWIPWALFVGGPLIPDAQLWFFRVRYQRRLDALVADLGNAGESLDAYRSIAELQRAMGAAEERAPGAPAEALARQPELAAAPPDEPLEEAQADAAQATRLKH